MLTMLGFNMRYGISLRKLRRIERDGQIKFKNAPDHWRRVVLDLRKRKMSARSIALAYLFPKKLEGMTDLTASDKKALREHFSAAGLPPSESPDDYYMQSVLGAAANEPKFLEWLVSDLKKIIPAKPVPHAYIAVRLLLPCDTDDEVDRLYRNLPKAFRNVFRLTTLKNWRVKSPIGNGRYQLLYCRPEHDL